MSTNSPSPRRNPVRRISDFLIRHLMWIALGIAGVVWAWRTMTPQELFTTEEARVRFLASVGAPPSTRIITLVTEWCPACKQLDRELTEKGVDHVRLDIESDPNGEVLFRRVYEITGSNSIPKVILDRNIVSRPALFYELARGK